MGKLKQNWPSVDAMELSVEYLGPHIFSTHTYV